MSYANTVTCTNGNRHALFGSRVRIYAPDGAVFGEVILTASRGLAYMRKHPGSKYTQEYKKLLAEYKKRYNQLPEGSHV